MDSFCFRLFLSITTAMATEILVGNTRRTDRQTNVKAIKNRISLFVLIHLTAKRDRKKKKMVTFDPYQQDPVDFAKLSGGLISIFFVLIMTTGLFSALEWTRPAKFCSYVSVSYFAVSTAYIMYGMVISFEVARKKFDRQN